MRAALERRQLPDAVPIWELSFHLWNGFSRKRVTVGVEFAALTPGEQERALYVNAEAMAAVSEELCFAAVSVPGNYWEVAPGVPSYYWLPEDSRWRQVEILAGALGDEVLLIGKPGGVISMPGPGNFVEFSYKLFDAPEEVDQKARQTLEGGLERAKRFLDLGVQGICTSSDLADNRGLYFSPPQMQRYVLPYLRTWAAKVRALGGYSILHTDGNITACIDDLAGSGLDALQAIDPVAKMDIAKVKAQVGNRLCLCGNIDCGLLLTGPPDAIYAATRELLLSCKPAGGFALGASNAVQEEVPPQNYQAMIQAWRDFGKY